jgi:hypothetical protein
MTAVPDTTDSPAANGTLGVLPDSTNPMKRADWMSELVYGTLTVLIAIAGFEVAGGGSPVGAGAIILAGSAATWLAHAYAIELGRRAALGHAISRGHFGRALLHALPIVFAAIPSVIAFTGATLAWWSSATAMGFSNAAGIVVLAGAGFVAARAAGSSLGGRLGSAALTASIGVGIVAVQMLFHH